MLDELTPFQSRKPASIGEYDAMRNSGKYEPTPTIKFHLDVTDKILDKLKSMLDDSNTKSGRSRVPLYTLRSVDKTTGEELTQQNMTLIKLKINCKSCNYSWRLNKHQILKNYARHKNLDLSEVREHLQNTNHAMEINQEFEKVKKKV